MTVQIVKPISDEDKNKLEKMYFYMYDIMTEMVSCSNLINMLYDFYNGNNHRFLNEDVGIIVERPNDIKKDIFVINARVPLHLLIVNIFKLGELIKQNQKFLKDYLKDETKSKLECFRREYFTGELITYRNKYVAHHRNNETNDFLSYDELIELLAKILNVSNGKISWESFIEYSENFYTKDLDKKSETICQIIHDMHIEIENLLGRKLNRKLAK